MRGKRFNLCLTKENHALKINYKLEKKKIKVNKFMQRIQTVVTCDET